MQELQTLGGKSSFLYEFSNGKLFIQFGKLKKPIFVDDVLIELVKERVAETPEPGKFMASNYNKKKWQNCKNNRICPYVAKIVISGILC